MLLRTQIALLLSGAILLVAVGVAGVGIWQRNLDAQRLTNIALALQSSLWNNLVDETVGDLNLVASELSVRLSNLAPSLSPDAIGDVIDASPDIVTPEITVQVVSNEGDLIRANATVLHSLPLIDRQILNRFSLGASMIGGLRQESRERFVIAAMRAIAIQGTQRALLSVSVPADEIVAQMADDIGEPLFLLSPRGRLVVGTDPALWARAQLSIPRHAARSRLIDVDGQSYFAVAMRVHDLSGREGGTMVALRDVTEAQLFSGGVERVGLVVVALAALLMVAALYALLRQAFQPLEDAVGVLDALSKGELPRPIDHTGAGEIGRIAKAVAVFRRNTQQLVDQNEAIARQRRRQERVIRRELERLAGLLDAEGRAEILGDLATVLPDNPDRQSASHMELATLAQLLSLMSKRIADQQNRLTGLVAELRDSIATRARLAALEQELDIARELQRTFLPQPLAPDPRIEVFGLSVSAKEVGGDFFDT
ncbi:MAG: HAMP domain-containing protein, partial [Pseudomonadota bacterium]